MPGDWEVHKSYASILLKKLPLSIVKPESISRRLRGRFRIEVDDGGVGRGKSEKSRRVNKAPTRRVPRHRFP